MESRADQVSAFAFALLLHVGLFLLAWLSARWIWPVHDEFAAGEPIQASLVMSAADVRRAQKAIKASPDPQPQPAPRPQTSEQPVQAKPQAPQDRPDTVDQVAASRSAPPSPDPAAQEQERRTRQAQVDLTEDLARQQEAENKQRLREQLEAIRREREKAARLTQMEEQRLAQLTDLAKPAPVVAKPMPSAPSAPAGDRGADNGLLARYRAAMQQTADANWNRTGAPERVRCKVRFTQYVGGEVNNVEFLDCPFDDKGRDSVDRALRRSPMPYAGFESVFDRQPTITFCYPHEECQP